MVEIQGGNSPNDDHMVVVQGGNSPNDGYACQSKVQDELGSVNDAAPPEIAAADSSASTQAGADRSASSSTGLLAMQAENQMDVVA